MLENFITAIVVIFDNINAGKQESASKRLINNSLIEKQFLAYYIYRVWIKYRKLMESVNTPTEFKRILSYLEIPLKYQDIYLTYPMANKMTINEKQLDLIILSILKQLNVAFKIYGQPGTTAKPKNKDYTMLDKYTEGKTVENIIQDIIQIKLLLPNLSRPANVVNIWEGIDQFLIDLDVIDEISGKPTSSNTNPATEIPESSFIQSQPVSSNQQQVSSNMSKVSSNQPQVSSNMPKNTMSSNKPIPSSTNKQVPPAPPQINKPVNTTTTSSNKSVQPPPQVPASVNTTSSSGTNTKKNNKKQNNFIQPSTV